MPWLKYRHKFASGKGSWMWRDLGRVENGTHDDETKYVVETLAAEYAYSDMYRGLDYDVIDDARVPRFVVEDAIRINTARFREAEQNARRLDEQLAIVTDCPVCIGLKPDMISAPVFDCPECGRERVFRTKIPSWAPPDTGRKAKR